MITSEKIIPWATGFLLGVLILTFSGSLFFFYIFQDRIYPGVEIDQISVGGLTKDQAHQLLEKRAALVESYSIEVMVDDIKIASSASQLEISRDFTPAIEQAYKIGRVKSLLNNLWTLTKISLTPFNLTTRLTYDQKKVNELVEELRRKVDLDGHNALATLKYSGSPYSLTIDPGQPGRTVLFTDTVALINNNIGQEQALTALVASTSSVLSDDQVKLASQKAAQLINKRLILKAEGVRLDLNDQQLVSLLGFPTGFNQEKEDLILADWKDEVDRQPQDARFDFDQETLSVKEFAPPRDGLELNQAETAQLIEENIQKLLTDQASETKVGINDQTNIELKLPVITTQPEVTLEDANQLGINERIGFGDSEYDHSIANRVHNVAITTKRINNTIVAPGEEFSFNKTLGEVSSRTGYRSAYVIKGGKTELGDGGGVCQVSTTTFRAVLDAGLEVTRRLPHSYRVSYYELNSKPGIDATVYAGETDFRFINDTDHHILIHGEEDSENLYLKIEIYGTSDGRATEIKDHQVWGYVPPLPTEYYPDPSLPTGVKKQIDWAVAGVKAKFTHIIRNAAGEITHQETYSSNYRPWSAKYLVGM